MLPGLPTIIKEAEADLRDLMAIPDNYKVLFLQGGASQQFAMIPMNLMKNRVADVPSNTSPVIKSSLTTAITIPAGPMFFCTPPYIIPYFSIYL